MKFAEACEGRLFVAGLRVALVHVLLCSSWFVSDALVCVSMLDDPLDVVQTEDCADFFPACAGSSMC